MSIPFHNIDVLDFLYLVCYEYQLEFLVLVRCLLYY